MKSFEIIRNLRANNSRLVKEQHLRDAWDNGCLEFFTGAKLCLDGLVSFGIKQVPVSSSNIIGFTDVFDDFLQLANALSSRALTGHAARDAVHDFMMKCDKESWDDFYRLILLKDLKAGVNDATLNKVLKAINDTQANQFVVPKFPYQRCCLPKDSDLSKFGWVNGVFSQTKADGMYAAVNKDKSGVMDILSRSGQVFPQEVFADLLEVLKQALRLNTQTHGELLIERDGVVLPRELGNGILNSVAQGGEVAEGDRIVYQVWDQIALQSAKSKGEVNIPYIERFANLTKQLESADSDILKMVETRIVHSYGEAVEHYKELVAAGFEGSIIKEPSAYWKDGTSKFQVKLKIEFDVELVVCGFNPGNGKNASTFGSIICRSADGLLEVNVSGFTDAARKKIWEDRESLLGSIMTVRSNDIMTPTKDGDLYSLFLPRFVEWRNDKSEADTLQQIQDQLALCLGNM